MIENPAMIALVVACSASLGWVMGVWWRHWMGRSEERAAYDRGWCDCASHFSEPGDPGSGRRVD